MSGHTANLSNEDIIFLYLSALISKESYDRLIENKAVSKTIQITENQYITQTIELDDEYISQIMNNAHYKHCIKICDKLESIVGIIREAFPDYYKELYQSMSVFMDDDIEYFDDEDYEEATE